LVTAVSAGGEDTLRAAVTVSVSDAVTGVAAAQPPEFGRRRQPRRRATAASSSGVDTSKSSRRLWWLASISCPAVTRSPAVTAAWRVNALRWSQPAPEFSLPSTLGRPVSLAEYRGKADVVLAFYCYDWGGI
jgi:hypothetical protein